MSRSIPPDQAGEILVTGCSTGIGRALALEFVSRGYRVLATARKLSALDDLAARGLATAALDVTDAASIAALDLGKRNVWMLVNNAGYGLMGPSIEVGLDDVRKQFETNVVGLLALSQAVAPAMMRARRGRIVNVSSVSGVLTTPFSGAYCASKGAVNALSDALRLELAPFGIDVITVQPGAIRSAFGENAAATLDDLAAKTEAYRPLADVLAQRARLSQQHATPAEAFARAFADAVLATKPKALVRIGNGSRLFPALARLPVRVRDRMLTRRFKLDRLRS